MAERVELSRLATALENLDYPLTRADAATALQGTTLVHPGGEDDLGALVSETGPDAFDGPDDVVAALHDVMPVSAPGDLSEAGSDLSEAGSDS